MKNPKEKTSSPIKKNAATVGPISKNKKQD